MVPIASAVATLDPQMAANSVQATTVTKPREPGSPPSQAAARLTKALAIPPNRMNAAAITNNGSAIKVGELSSLMTSCAAPTSGWPDAMNMAPAHSPSTRKTGIPVASSPTNSARKLVMSPASIDAWQLMTARTARGHGAAARLGNQPNQPDDIADQH